MTPIERPEATATWSDGWYRFARACASPNFGRRPAQTAIDLVILHSISLPPGEFGNGYVGQLFCNQLDWDAHPYFQTIRGLQVSAHFFIARAGELTQFVSCDARAWHAGVSKYGARENCNDFSIGIELEGLEGDPFTDAQYETLQALLPALVSHYPIQGICGHSDVAPGRKSDPGDGFAWRRLEQSLGLAPDFFWPRPQE